MHPQVPLLLYYSFLVLSVGTFLIIGREVRRRFPEKRSVMYLLSAWFLVQYLAGKYGLFALGLGELPPKIMFIVVPNFLVLGYLAFSAAGKEIAKHFSLTFLTAVQMFRLFVEVVLWQLAAKELLPEVMSVEGRNFDILIGITAPMMAYLIVRGSVSNRTLILWNVAGLLLLTNVVLHGMLTVPGIELIRTNIPNFIISYAPFNLLPGVLVPFAYALHILSLRKLLAS